MTEGVAVGRAASGLVVHRVWLCTCLLLLACGWMVLSEGGPVERRAKVKFAKSSRIVRSDWRSGSQRRGLPVNSNASDKQYHEERPSKSAVLGGRFPSALGKPPLGKEKSGSYVAHPSAKPSASRSRRTLKTRSTRQDHGGGNFRKRPAEHASKSVRQSSNVPVHRRRDRRSNSTGLAGQRRRRLDSAEGSDEDKDRGSRLKLVVPRKDRSGSHFAKEHGKGGNLQELALEDDDSLQEGKKQEPGILSSPAPDTLDSVWPLLYETYLMPPTGLQQQADLAAERQARQMVSAESQAEFEDSVYGLSVMNRLWAAVHGDNVYEALKKKSTVRHSSAEVNWFDSLKRHITGQVLVEIGSGVTSLAAAEAYPDLTVVAITTERDQLAKLQQQVATFGVQNMHLCYVAASEVPAKMKSLHRSSLVMFGTLVVSNLTALVDGHLPHEFEGLLAMLMGLAQVTVFATPHDVTEQTRAFFESWKGYKDMIERALVLARITAKIENAVKDEQVSRLLPAHAEDQYLPKEYLDTGNSHYASSTYHLLALVVNVSSSQRRLNSETCLQTRLRAKYCKLVNLVINGTTFVFVQPSSSSKKKSKSKLTFLHLKDTVTSLAIHDLLVMNPVPSTLRYLSEQLNSQPWQLGQSLYSLRLSGDRIVMNTTLGGLYGELQPPPQPSSGAVSVHPIPPPRYIILVSSPSQAHVQPEDLENARYPEVAGPQSVEPSRNDGGFVNVESESEPDNPQEGAAVGAMATQSEDNTVMPATQRHLNLHGVLPGPMPHPRSVNDGDNVVEGPLRRRDDEEGEQQENSDNGRREGTEHNDETENTDSHRNQEGDFAGVDPGAEADPAGKADSDNVQLAGGEDAGPGARQNWPNADHANANQQPAPEPDRSLAEEDTNSRNKMVARADVDERQRQGNPGDEDVTRDHLGPNGQPETEFKNDDVVLEVGKSHADESQEGQNDEQEEDEQRENGDGVDGNDGQRSTAPPATTAAPEIPTTQPTKAIEPKSRQDQEEGKPGGEEAEEEEEEEDANQPGRHLLSISSQSYQVDVAHGPMRRLLWTGRSTATSSKSTSRIPSRPSSTNKLSSSSSTSLSTSASTSTAKKSKDGSTVSGTGTAKATTREAGQSTSASSPLSTLNPAVGGAALEELAQRAALEMQDEEVKKRKVVSEETLFDAQWSVLKRELRKAPSQQFSVFVYGGLTQVLVACKIAHLWPESSVLLVVKPTFPAAFAKYRKLRSNLKLSNIVGTMKLLTPALSYQLHKEVDVAQFQVLSAAIFAEIVTEPEIFIPHLSRLLTFARTTFLELPSPKQLNLSSQLLAGMPKENPSTRKLQGLIHRALFLASAHNASLSLLPVSLPQQDIWASGFPLLRASISRVSRQVATDCVDATSSIHLLASGLTSLEHRTLARAGRGFSLSSLLLLGLAETEKQQLFVQYLKLPLYRDMCPKFVLWKAGSLLYDNLRTTLQVSEQYPFQSKEALVHLLLANVDKTRRWSFMEYGSGHANSTIDVARAHPNCTFISLESSTQVAYRQQKRLDELNVTNMVVGRIESDASLLRKLLESPDMMRYQMIGLDYFLKMIQSFSRPNFNLMLGSVFSTGVSSFVQLPSAKMLSLAFLTFFSELPGGFPKSSVKGAYLLANHPTSLYENAELRMVGESTKSPTVSSVRSHLLHPFVGNSEQEHGWKLMRVNLLNLTTTVNHHFDYAIDGHDRKYTQHCESNATHFRVFLERQVDGFVIPYERLEAISLIALLRLGLVSEVKARLYEQFIKMPLYEDMAPWNIVFNGGHLEYIDYDTKDQTFDKMVGAAYQVMSVLMNFQRTVKDFGHCGDGEARTAYNFPYMGSCVGSSFHGKCRNSKYPVPCGDHSCRSTYIECLNALLDMEKKKDMKAEMTHKSLLALRQPTMRQMGPAAAGQDLETSPPSPYDGGHWSFDENGYRDPAKKPINTGIR